MLREEKMLPDAVSFVTYLVYPFLRLAVHAIVECHLNKAVPDQESLSACPPSSVKHTRPGIRHMKTVINHTLRRGQIFPVMYKRNNVWSRQLSDIGIQIMYHTRI